MSQLARGPKNSLPLNSQVPSGNLKMNGSKREARVDPFAVPDNDYSDSFVDLLWINLLSSRMATAVEAEAFDATDRVGTGTAAYGGTTGGGGGPGAARGRNGGGLAPPKSGSTGAAVGGSTAASTEIEMTRRRLAGGMGGGYTYEDYVGLATKLQAGAPERQRAVVRGVLRSVFPEWFPAFYRMLFPPSKVCQDVFLLWRFPCLLDGGRCRRPGPNISRQQRAADGGKMGRLHGHLHTTPELRAQVVKYYYSSGRM